MNTGFKLSPKASDKMHIRLPDKSETLRILPILLVHIPAGAIILVFHDHQWFIQG